MNLIQTLEFLKMETNFDKYKTFHNPFTWLSNHISCYQQLSH